MHPAIIAVLDIGTGICRAVGLGGVGAAEIDLSEELIRGYLFKIRFRTDDFNGRYARLSYDRLVSGGDIDKRDIVGTHELLCEVTPLISTVTLSFVSPLMTLTPLNVVRSIVISFLPAPSI